MNTNRLKTSLFRIVRNTLGSALMLCLTAPLAAWGLNFDNPKMSGSFDSTVTVGFGMRMEDPSPTNVGIGNGGTYPTLNEDNGNLNYGKGSFYSRPLNQPMNWQFIMMINGVSSPARSLFMILT